jgi:hypothetical protein
MATERNIQLWRLLMMENDILVILEAWMIQEGAHGNDGLI